MFFIPVLMSHRISSNDLALDHCLASNSRCCFGYCSLLPKSEYFANTPACSLNDPTGFIEVFLSLIDDVETEGDIKDVITEFNNFLDVSLSLDISMRLLIQMYQLQEQYPSRRFKLDGTLGVKDTFEDIEGLVGHFLFFPLILLTFKKYGLY